MALPFKERHTMKANKGSNLCECGRPSALKAGERPNGMLSNGCPFCLRIESELFAEKMTEAAGNRVACGVSSQQARRNSTRHDSAANPLKKGALIAIDRACDRFLQSRGLSASAP